MNQMNNRRILVVDDDPSIHEDFRKTLAAQDDGSEALDDLERKMFGDTYVSRSPESFELDSAFRGQEALLCVQQALEEQRPFTVAFVDVRMPGGWDGIETVEHLMKEDTDLQLVICTAYSDHSADEILTRLGVSDRLLFLRKPCDYAQIVLTAQVLNQKWHLQHTLSELRSTPDSAVSGL
jgi:CheY-like chemotaxis protein